MTKTKIPWADFVWNPTTGCSPCSPACEHCFAKRLAEGWLRGRCGYPADEPFRVTLHPERLDAPLHMKKPSRILVTSMGDLFHEDVPDTFIKTVWCTMFKRPQHTFIILTKRAGRMREVLSPFPFLANVWLGVSVWDQASADAAWEQLRQTPAAVRFMSYEPALGPVDFTRMLGLDKAASPVVLSLIIAGGETGPGARVCNADWLCGAWRQCQAAGVAFFFKGPGDNFVGSGSECADWQTVRMCREFPEARQRRQDNDDTSTGMEKTKGVL